MGVVSIRIASACMFVLLVMPYAASAVGVEADAPASQAMDVPVKDRATEPGHAARPGRNDVIEHDFGQVWAGDPVSHTFEVPNTADRTASITNVRTTCGCTVVGKYDKQAPAGGAWHLQVTLSTAGRSGKTTKRVTVTTDDPARPHIDLVLTGRITPRFEMAPSQYLRFGALQSTSTASQTVTITSRLDQPVTLTLTPPAEKFLKADLAPIEPGRKYELTVETVPPLPLKRSLGQIELATNQQAQPKILIPIYGHVQPRVQEMGHCLYSPPMRVVDKAYV